MNPLTGVCVLLTIVFSAVSIILARYQKKARVNPDLDPSTCYAIAIYDPNIRKRRIWSYICVGLAILFMILTLVTVIQSKKPKISQAVTTPTISPNSALEITCSPEPTQTTEPDKTTIFVGSSEQDVCLDEIAPVLEIPGNFYFDSWSDGTQFNIDGKPCPSGIGMCITGTNNEKWVVAPEAPEGLFRKDCLEVSMLFPLRGDYESLVFSIGADKSDLSLYGPRETNGVARVTISDTKKEKPLFDSEWIDYTYADHDLEIDISNVDVLQITFRSSGVGEKRIIKSLRFVIANPSLTPLVKS